LQKKVWKTMQINLSHMVSSGEIWLIDFNPSAGSEQSGRRPAVVISGNAMNNNYNLSIVTPLTTSIKNMPGSVQLTPNETNNLNKNSEVLIIHVKSVSHHRFRKKIGVISLSELSKIKQNINKILKY